MSKFIYRMQSVLDVKQKLEEQAKMEFATARARLNEEEEKLRYLEGRKLSYEEQGRKLQESGLNVLDILENRDVIARMKEFIDLQMVAIKQAERQMEAAREKLQEAVQESKIHAKLREKAFEEFMQEENKREAKEVDELTSYTYGQKK